MKLIKLYANQKSFRTVTFNENGISLITARKKTNRNSDTYNSVGKSLMIFLIHFCLGARKSEPLEEKLPNWIFSLEFKIRDKLHYCSRSTSNQNVIIYDGREMKWNDFNKKMGQDIFDLSENIKEISFRSLITRFIRNGKFGYNRFNQFMEKEQEDKALINTAFLLGLDVNLAVEKKNQREEANRLKKQEKDLNKDSTLKNAFFQGDVEDVDVAIMNLEKDISKLTADITKFKIANDYGNVKKEADELSNKLVALRNENFKYKMLLDSIEKSMQRKPDISKDCLVAFFDDVNINLGDKVKKRIEDVENFNKHLLADRFKILNEQKTFYLKLLDDTNKTIEELSLEEDRKLQYLNSHGALDDYTKLSNYLTDKQISLDRLNQYKKLHGEFSMQKEEIKKQMAEQNIKTQQYLDAHSELTKNLLNLFHSFASVLYGNTAAALTIKNNDGENKLRYNIDAHIPADAGDGVLGACIFCFDWTLMNATKGMFSEFIVHDSRLMTGTDTRQIASMLKIAKEECSRLNCQYILTLNDSTIENLKKELPEEEFDDLITKNQILELNDDDDKNKLLGTKIDLKYE